MSRYTSPVNPAVFPHLTVVLLAIGMFFTAWFFVYPFLISQWARVSDGESMQGTLTLPAVCVEVRVGQGWGWPRASGDVISSSGELSLLLRLEAGAGGLRVERE